MAGFTNRGKKLWNEYATGAGGVSRPTNFYIMLFTSATAPTADTNVASDLTEIAAGNGYTTGGYSLTPGGTDFDTITEDDSGDLSKVQIKDVAWTASGGAIPASGSGARYACMVTDEATIANRQVIAYWSLGSDRTVSDTQVFTLQDLTLQLSES